MKVACPENPRQRSTMIHKCPGKGGERLPSLEFTCARASSLAICRRATSASAFSSSAAYSGCAAAKPQCSSAVLAIAAYASTREGVHIMRVPLHCHLSCMPDSILQLTPLMINA